MVDAVISLACFLILFSPFPFSSSFLSFFHDLSGGGSHWCRDCWRILLWTVGFLGGEELIVAGRLMTFHQHLVLWAISRDLFGRQGVTCCQLFTLGLTGTLVLPPGKDGAVTWQEICSGIKHVSP